MQAVHTVQQECRPSAAGVRPAPESELANDAMLAVPPAVLKALQVRADCEARVGAQVEQHHAVGGQERRRRVEPRSGLAVGEEGDLLVDFAASARRIYVYAPIAA